MTGRQGDGCEQWVPMPSPTAALTCFLTQEQVSRQQSSPNLLTASAACIKWAAL